MSKGILAFTCEELVTGVSNPGLNPGSASNGFQPNFGVPAVPVNAPLIVEPPAISLGGGGANLGRGVRNRCGIRRPMGRRRRLAVSRRSYLFASLDARRAAAPGILDSGLPARAGWDAVDTLAVNLTESGGTLSGTTQAAAQHGGTLSLVDGEFLGYEVATLTTVSNYNLTGLARGLGGSSPTAHSTGAPFARLDGAVGRFDLPANLAGKMLFFKFQSFNTLGGGLQDLSTCTVYTYATTGSGLAEPDLRATRNRLPSRPRRVVDAPTLADDFGSVAVAASASLDLGAHRGYGRQSDRRAITCRVAGRPRASDWRRDDLR